MWGEWVDRFRLWISPALYRIPRVCVPSEDFVSHARTLKAQPLHRSSLYHQMTIRTARDHVTRNNWKYLNVDYCRREATWPLRRPPPRPTRRSFLKRWAFSFYYNMINIFEVEDSSPHIQQVFADSVDDNDCQDGFGKKKNMTDKIAMMIAQVRESNTACQAGDFEKAVGLYTEAIALDKCNHILYSNRLDYSWKWSRVLFFPMCSIICCSFLIRVLCLKSCIFVRG